MTRMHSPSDHPQAAKATDKAITRYRDFVSDRERNAIAQLPLWPEPKRGAPNAFLRSCVFAAIHGKDRIHMVERALPSQQGITVKFTGEQLNQNDLDVWLSIVQKARDQPLGSVASFTAHSLLSVMDLPKGNSQHKQLHSTLVRLTACALEITHDGRTYFGPLIKSGAKDEITRHYAVELNKGIIALFGDNHWTALDWAQRRKIRNKPLAQALHSFYSSHSEPFPLKLETLKQYTGSLNKQMAGFKRAVVAALEILVWVGFLTSYSIDGDLVSVRRAPKALRSA